MANLKILEIRAAFQKLADEQPVHNNVRTWALEAVTELPAYAVQRIAELLATKKED